MTDTAVTDNETMGMWASGPEVIVLRCIFARNVAGFGNPAGLLAFSPALTIEDCLIADHRNVFWGGIIGLAVWSSSGSVSGCTVVGNALAGESAAVSVIDSNVTVDRCIVAFNEGVALECSGAVSVRCCDLYGNATGNDLCGEDLGGNFSADPLFCDMENWDYSLDAQSPCLPGNHPDEVDCGLIGARGQGCGGTPVQEATWGRLKLLYRGR